MLKDLYLENKEVIIKLIQHDIANRDWEKFKKLSRGKFNIYYKGGILNERKETRESRERFEKVFNG